MVLAIFILVVFQILAEFNRPHLPTLSHTKREDEDMEGGTANEYPVPPPGKFNICIAWEILNMILGAELMACSLYKIDAGMIFFYRQ